MTEPSSNQVDSSHPSAGGRGLALPLALIFCAALTLRLAFLNTPQVPVVWDAAGYHLQARAFLAAFERFSDRPFFGKEFRRAFDMASFKGEVYPLFLTGIYALFGTEAQAARIAQAALDSLTCVLVSLVALHCFRRRGVAVASGLLAALYLPLIFSSGRLLTETLGVFLVVLLTWLLFLAVSRASPALALAAGIVTALTMVCRTAFQYIFPFTTLILAFLLGLKNWKKAFIGVPLYLIGIALLIVPRMYYTAKIYGAPLLSGSWRNGEAVYAGIAPLNQGFQAEAVEMTGELREAAARRGGGGIRQEDYYRAYLLTLGRYPLRSLAIIGSKLKCFWDRPYNDFNQEFLAPWPAFLWFHRLLLIFSLFGIPLAFRSFPRALLLLVILLYLAWVPLLADMETRYGLPAIPFLIILAAGFAFFLGESVRRLIRARRAASLAVMPAASVVLFLLSRVLTLPRLQIIFPTFSPSGCQSLHLLVFHLFWLSLVLILYRLGRAQFSRSFSLFLSVFPVLVILWAADSYSWIDPYWHEWTVRLSEPGQKVRQKLELPEDLAGFRQADLKIDMQGGGGKGFDLLVSVDGKPARLFQRGLTMDWDHYIRTRRAFNVYLRFHKRGLGDLKQWFTVPLDMADLSGKKEIMVEISLAASAFGPADYVDVFGDYLPPDDRLFWEGPTWSQEKTELSAYKYAVEDDWRLWRRDRIGSAVSSSHYDGRTWREGDLSDHPGAQTGRYRVFLTLSRQRRAAPVQPTALAPDDLITRSVASPAHRVQVWMIRPDKKRSDRIRIEAAHAAAGEEGGFSLVAYADTDGDGLPDALIGKSPFLTAEKDAAWSGWEFETPKEVVFVGTAWEIPARVYYSGGEWDNDILIDKMYYTNNPRALPRLTIAPKVTNLRVTFLGGNK